MKKREDLIPHNIRRLLEKADFINVATCALSRQPSAAFKFILKIEGNDIYLADFAKARTWRNVKQNPRASLSIIDNDILIDYQLNGKVEIIQEGSFFEKLDQELDKKEVTFATKRVIESVRRQKKYAAEVPLAKKIVILKIAINEVRELGPAAELKLSER
jgi:general stress protein 26